MSHFLKLLKLLGAFALSLSFIAIPTASYAGVFVGVGVGLNINVGPPALPVYDQPPCPEPNLIWTPGYWSYGSDGYYWVPGTWVSAPEVGDLWTPGYWGEGDSGYSWNAGYWGSEVGFYGGINYGNGYFGDGYSGGRWNGNRFRYNTAYTNVNRGEINDTYDDRTRMNAAYGGGRGSHVSYNGGAHGVNTRPTSTQLAYTRQSHAGSTSVQRENAQVAAGNRNYLATVNHGHPTNGAFARPLTATNRPDSFAPRSTTERSEPVTSHGSRNAYSAPQTSHATNTYHARTTYPAASTYHAPTSDRAPSTYHAPTTLRPAYQPSTTYHAPAAYRGGNAVSAPRGGGAPQGGGGPRGGGGAPHGGGGGAPHGGGHSGGGEHR